VRPMAAKPPRSRPRPWSKNPPGCGARATSWGISAEKRSRNSASEGRPRAAWLISTSATGRGRAPAGARSAMVWYSRSQGRAVATLDCRSSAAARKRSPCGPRCARLPSSRCAAASARTACASARLACSSARRAASSAGAMAASIWTRLGGASPAVAGASGARSSVAATAATARPPAKASPGSRKGCQAGFGWMAGACMARSRGLGERCCADTGLPVLGEAGWAPAPCPAAPYPPIKPGTALHHDSCIDGRRP